jgi:hypothetical protein
MNLLMCRNGILFYQPRANEYYGQLKLSWKTGQEFGTSDVYIVDKKRNLRGRKRRVMRVTILSSRRRVMRC